MAREEEASLIIRIKEKGRDALANIKKGLDEIGLQATVAFAAISAFVGKAVLDYKEAEAATNKLNAVLAANGLLYTEVGAKYQQYAKELQAVTTMDGDATIAALAHGQALAGNIEFTKQNIEAVMNFAAATGQDLQSAMAMVGKTVGSGKDLMAKYGITVDENVSASERLSQITKQLDGRFSGLARSQAEGLGVLDQLKNTVGDFMEGIGEQFAPAVESVGRVLKKFFESFQEHPILMKFAAGLLAAGGAITAIIAGLYAMVSMAPIVATAVNVMLGPIGLIAAAVAALVAAWTTNFYGIQNVTFGVFDAIKALFMGFTDKFADIFSNLGDIIAGAFTLDGNRIKSAYDSLKADLAKIGTDTVKAFNAGWEEGAKEKTDLSDLIEGGAKLYESAKKKGGEVVDALKDVWKDVKGQIDVEMKMDHTKEKERTVNSTAAVMKDVERDPTLAEQMAASWTNIMNAAAAKVDSERPISGIFSTAVGAVVDAFLPGLGQLVEKVINNLTMETDDFIKHVEDGFARAFDDTDFLANLLINGQKWLEISHENLPKMIEQMIESLIGALPDFMVGFWEHLASDPEFTTKLVVAIIEGVLRGLETAINRSGEIITGGVEYYMDKMNNAMEVWAFEMGKFILGAVEDFFVAIGQELENAPILDGLQSAADAILGAFHNFAGQVSPAMDKISSQSTAIRDAVNGIGDGIASVGERIVGFVDSLRAALKPITDAVEKVSGGVSSVGGSLPKPPVPKFHSGGYVGSPIQKFALGGTVDDVPALLQAGEFVVNREATKNNLGALQAMNAGVGGGGGAANVTIVVNGGLLGDERTAMQFARAVDQQLMKLRRGNESLAFDSGIT